MFLARLIPRVCHNVNRVCYIHGDLVRDQILDITPTYPTSLVLATARQVDYAATQVSLLYRVVQLISKRCHVQKTVNGDLTLILITF